MINLFRFRTVKDLTTSLANYLPGGKLFRTKYDPTSNIYMFLNGLSEEIFRCNNLLRAYSDQYYPDGTTDFLTEWEQTLGIPDDCFPVEGLTIEERRTNVLIKLSGLNIQTAGDFEAVALALGLVVTVVGGKDASVLPVIVPDKTARFTIVVQFVPVTGFDYDFDIPFGDDAVTLLTCVFQRSRPANCQVLFQAV